MGTGLSHPFLDGQNPAVLHCTITFTPFCFFPFAFDQLDCVWSGAVAQLGARVNGIHEVAGSIPASSTNPTFG